jgi:putative DNA modification/repair radical SAM protein
VEVSPDHTAERIIRAIRILRENEGFSGYIHAKIIPGVSPELVHRIGLLADRLSVNIELPTTKSLELLAPQKKMDAIARPMKQITETIKDRKLLAGRTGGFTDICGNPLMIAETPEGKAYGPAVPSVQGRYREKFAPAGQSTQMIIGATPETDRRIIKTSESLYKAFLMKRVYYSAYIPVGNPSSGLLPSAMTAPPLRREHRLYQADWLMRYYEFSADEIVDETDPFLDLELDPKIAWALRNISRFPIEVNKAGYEELLRIPGIGMVSAQRIMRQRRLCAVKFEDLKKLGVVVKRAQFFLTCCGKYYGSSKIDPEKIRKKLIPAETQLSLFNETGLAPASREVTMHG